MLPQRCAPATAERTQRPAGESIQRNPASRRLSWAIGLVTCVVVGASIATLPHIVNWARHCSLVWFADEDEVLYLSVAAKTLNMRSMALQDPAHVEGGPVIYQWMQIGPTVLAARLLQLKPAYLGFFWRLCAGGACGAAWYLILAALGVVGWLRLLGTVFLLVDCGYSVFWPVVRSYVLLLDAMRLGAASQIFALQPSVHREWRAPSPALYLPALFGFLAMWYLARRDGRRSYGIAAGLMFGLLFYIFFYYWTAVGLALLVVVLVDQRKFRRLHVMVVGTGTALGIFGIVSNVEMRWQYGAQWLARNDMFVKVPHLVRPSGTSLLLVGLAGTYCFLRRRDLVPIWAVAATAWILSYHQLMTGREIQNYHWEYVAAPITALVLVVALATEWKRAPRLLSIGVAALLVCHGAVGLWLRYEEGVYTSRSTRLVDTFRQCNADLATAPLEGVIAGDESCVKFLPIINGHVPLVHYASRWSPGIGDAELDERNALNGVLVGLDRAAFERAERTALSAPFSPELHDPALREAHMTRAMATYDRVAANALFYVAGFGVGSVILSKDASLPEALRTGWRRQGQGEHWQVWVRRRGSSN